MNYKMNFDEVPCAYITKQKQRVKQFGQNVYLKDGSEFEVELYNPSKKTVLSKIKINGEFINGGGIILRPGERVFLERYLDVAKKFKFETYSVDSSPQTQNAIASNGDIEVYFHDEEDPIELRINNVWGTLNNPNVLLDGITYYDTNGTGNINYTSTSDVVGLNLTNFSNEVNYKQTSFSNNDRSNKFEQRPRSRSLIKKSVETGRVEKGSESNQTFKTVNKNFNVWSVSTSVWKILPESQKPIEKSDLIEKCPKCSTKVKKSSWKFCPECGSELKRTKTEIHYTLGTYILINGKHYTMVTYSGTLDDFLERNKNKLIYIKSDSLTEHSLRAIVID